MARIGSVRLSGGMHVIRVPYFQGPRTTVALMLEVAGPGEGARIFSTEEFKPPVDPETWRFPTALQPPVEDPDLERIHPDRIRGPENGERVEKRRRNQTQPLERKLCPNAAVDGVSSRQRLLRA